MNADDFQKELSKTGKKVTNLLSSAQKPLTAWDLKMALKDILYRLSFKEAGVKAVG